MNHQGSLFPLLLIGVLAALTFWLQSVAEPDALNRSGKTRHDPDFIVESFTVKRFDREGMLQHTLEAPRMEHFPDDDSTLVSKPQVIFHRSPPSFLTADTAQVSRDAKEVRLSGNVRFVRKLDDALETRVTTSWLSIFPDEESARTNAPVRIFQGLSSIEGAGLSLDNKTHKTTLLGPVSGTIHRKPPDTGRKLP